jgi:hypothetical protein
MNFIWNSVQRKAGGACVFSVFGEQGHLETRIQEKNQNPEAEAPSACALAVDQGGGASVGLSPYLRLV